jgi:hypothetical protein
VANSNIILALLVVHARVGVAGICLIICHFQSFVDEISFFVLPLGIGLLNALEEDAWAIMMVKIVLFESEHLVIELSQLVPPFQVLL